VRRLLAFTRACKCTTDHSTGRSESLEGHDAKWPDVKPPRRMTKRLERRPASHSRSATTKKKVCTRPQGSEQVLCSARNHQDSSNHVLEHSGPRSLLAEESKRFEHSSPHHQAPKRLTEPVHHGARLRGVRIPLALRQSRDSSLKVQTSANTKNKTLPDHRFGERKQRASPPATTIDLLHPVTMVQTCQ
jgi:hypothetical protein